MYFNVSITGSTYTQSSGIIDVSIYGGSPPYLIHWLTTDLSPFPGILIDNSTYPGIPQYTKAINVPIGLYYVSVTDQYGLGEHQQECIIVNYSGFSQQNIDNTPIVEDIITFPCEYSNTDHEYCNSGCTSPNYFWLTTEDGCYINLSVNNCNEPCFLVGSSCYTPDGCMIMGEGHNIGISDECGWTILIEDGNPPM